MLSMEVRGAQLLHSLRNWDSIRDVPMVNSQADPSLVKYFAFA